MKLVVGLGNPGREYENTYHNLGFMAIDKVCESLKININKSKNQALFTKTKIDGQIVFFVKPLSYMNLSGQVVLYFSKFYKINPKDILVLCDDIDLPKGTLRFRENGSGGTHNGLKNIVFMLASEDFARIKIGAGKDKTIDLKDYVLSKIDDESFNLIRPCFDKAVEKVLTWIKNG